MALFQVTRYFGDEEVADGKKNEPCDILKILQDQAEARRKSVSQNQSFTVDSRTNLVDCEQDGTEIDSSVLECTVKKKKKPISDSFASVTNEVSSEAEKEVKKKKKKRKHKLSNSDVLFDSTVDTEIVVKKIKLEEVDVDQSKEQICDTAEAETSTRKHKKHKKHKNRESVDKHEPKGSDVLDSVDDVEVNTKRNDEEFGSMADDDSDNKEHADEKLDDTPNKNEIGGFTLLGSVRPAKLEKVHRVLPDWLAKPTIISADLDSDKLPVTEMPGLALDLVEKLRENKISHFFPVQHKVIPALLESSLTGFQTGRAGYRPSDICVSAPTGSGKTLAFVLPIVQALRNRMTCEVRALAVLPVRDLATQVFKVFQTYCKGTKLKVGLMIGQKTFLAEQQSLVKKRLKGYQNMFDILVATPGRLVDHINKTDGFHLEHLRYLVIDEADRMMDEIKQDWLIQVENSVYRSRPRPGPLTAASCWHMNMPLQKLLYSATLSQNPEKLQQLNLFQPKLFTSVVKSRRQVATTSACLREPVGEELAEDGRDQILEASGVTQDYDKHDEDTGDGSTVHKDEGTESPPKASANKPQKAGDFVGKYATPSSLSEYVIETTAAEKPLIVLHLLHHLNYRNILCFTNSVEATHRLCVLLKLYGGIVAKEFSSNLHAARRNGIIQKFVAGKIDILVCSDAMARGMDISNVKFVVSYDPPPYIQTYIHRIGRTARAGKEGSAFTLLQKKEFFHFKKMVRDAGKSNPSPLKISKADLKPLLPKYEEALKQLGDVLKNEKPKRRYTRKKLQKPEVKDKTG